MFVLWLINVEAVLIANYYLIFARKRRQNLISFFSLNFVKINSLAQTKNY